MYFSFTNPNLIICFTFGNNEMFFVPAPQKYRLIFVWFSSKCIHFHYMKSDSNWRQSRSGTRSASSSSPGPKSKLPLTSQCVEATLGLKQLQELQEKYFKMQQENEANRIHSGPLLSLNDFFGGTGKRCFFPDVITCHNGYARVEVSAFPQQTLLFFFPVTSSFF